MKEDKEQINIDAVDWYTKNRGLYKQLSEKVHNIIFELLEVKNLNVHAIFNRPKDVSSFSEKIKNSKYTKPEVQVTDLAGIRVICYVESDIEKICSIIEDNFEIDKPNSTDKSKLLGTDKVGYKSVHYIAKLKEIRLQLPEYKKFSDCKFEIQIRTILQHAWAEIEHDRNYKFAGELPDEIQRRFKLLAGTLELVDREFDNIAIEIDKISEQVSEGTKEGKLDFEINSTTLKQFLLTKFASIIPSKITPDFNYGEIKVLDELKDFGFRTLDDLNNSIPDDFIKTMDKLLKQRTNFLGLLRTLMIISDWDKYFDKAYKTRWTISTLKSKESLYKHYNVSVEEIVKKYVKQ
jgi:putative GTP pyrophosphokinase